MRIINRYILRECLVAFCVTLFIFMFVMAVANLFKVIDLFARGVSGGLIMRIFLYGMPASLIFAIPMSALAAVFLTFSRMAADREVVAMQSCGISIWQIISMPLLLACVLCAVCVYINSELAPASHFARRQVVEQLKVETPLSFLDEGRFIRDLPGYTIYIGRKRGNSINDVVIYEFGEYGPRQTVRADSGEIRIDPEDERRILIDLRKVRIEQADDDDPANLQLMRRISAEEYPVVFDLSEMIRSGIIWKNRSNLSMDEIFRALRGDYGLRRQDIKDLPGLVHRLTRPPLNAAVQQVFTPSARLLLRAAAEGMADANALRDVLTSELNRVIMGAAIYDPALFAGLELDQYVQELLERPLTVGQRRRLNRMLLEKLFPLLIENHYLTHVLEDDLSTRRTALILEASTRMGLAFSCLAFALLGAALGIKIHRRESYVGMSLALLLVFVFYLFIIVADALVGKPHFHPYLIVWIPFVISNTIAFILLRRAA